MMKHRDMLPLTRVSASRFTWSGKLGTAEVSDLIDLSGGLISRVYRDSCDVGFLVWSPRSERTVLFTMTDELRDRDNDFQGWILQDAEGMGLEIHVFND